MTGLPGLPSLCISYFMRLAVKLMVKLNQYKITDSVDHSQLRCLTKNWKPPSVGVPMRGTEGLGVPPTNKNGKEKQKKKQV